MEQDIYKNIKGYENKYRETNNWKNVILIRNKKN